MRATLEESLNASPSGMSLGMDACIKALCRCCLRRYNGADCEVCIAVHKYFPASRTQRIRKNTCEHGM
jgi:hypothetical protein